MQPFGQFVEHVQHAVIPAALVTRRRKNLVEGRPEPQRAIANRQQRRFGQTALVE
jgi:hypothetical protein